MTHIRSAQDFPARYVPAENRYERMLYNRCGKSGLKLPAVSLGLWHNFGEDTPHQTKRAICRTAFDHGITHFDLANNYGPPFGSAEEAFGQILRQDFQGLRDDVFSFGNRKDAREFAEAIAAFLDLKIDKDFD